MFKLQIWRLAVNQPDGVCWQLNRSLFVIHINYLMNFNTWHFNWQRQHFAVEINNIDSMDFGTWRFIVIGVGHTGCKHSSDNRLKQNLLIISMEQVAQIGTACTWWEVAMKGQLYDEMVLWRGGWQQLMVRQLSRFSFSRSERTMPAKSRLPILVMARLSAGLARNVIWTFISCMKIRWNHRRNSWWGPWQTWPRVMWRFPPDVLANMRGTSSWTDSIIWKLNSGWCTRRRT